MARRKLRVRPTEDGRLEVVDPGFDVVPLLREMDPAFRVRRAPLPRRGPPRFVRARACRAGVPGEALGAT